MKVDIVGAGMAGLLAGAMLRKQCRAIYEAQRELPNNHSAVLRFRSSVVADVLNIPFKQVQAVKAVEPWRNPIADAMAYSRKTNGTATMRSVLTATSEPQTRYIAPPDLINKMAEAVEAPIELGKAHFFCTHRPIISTIPMPSLMAVLEYPEQESIKFESRRGLNVVVKLADCDAYCSLYVADPTFPAARISITGNELVAECYGGWEPLHQLEFAEECVRKMGLHDSQIRDVEAKAQRYGKILPIAEDVRRRFIMWASEVHGVYSLGRFATWRPGLLLDDVVNDVRVIQRLIANSGEAYPHKKRS